MRLLLDTHAFLWWNIDDPRLTERAREAIADGANEVFLSAASGWEIAIKWQKGRLSLPGTPETYISSRMASNAIQALPVEIRHATAVASLPPFHADPFDRLLISQARCEGLSLVTGDLEFAKYDVEIVW